MYKFLQFLLSEWDDIAYSYLVGEDGGVYEGRGADVRSATAHGWNDESFGIAFIGNFTERRPSAQAMQAMCLLLDWLVEQGAQAKMIAFISYCANIWNMFQIEVFGKNIPCIAHDRIF